MTPVTAWAMTELCYASPMFERLIKTESDTLLALRSFSYIWCVLALITLGTYWFVNGASDIEWARRIGALIHAGVWAMYLSLTSLQSRMGAWYLPVALLIVIVGSFFVSVIPTFLVTNFEAGTPEVIAPVIIRMSFLWVMSMIVVARQYRLRHVAATALSFGILALLLGFPSTFREAGAFERVFVFALLSTISSSAVGYLVWRLSQAERYQRYQLAKANMKLRQQAIRQEELTISRERTRLARELHDTLAHSLSGVAVQIEAVRALWDSNPERAEIILARIDETARTGLTEARRALQALRATPLQDLGLALALETAGEEAASRAGATLHTDLPTRLAVNLEPHVEQGLYRIAQEALENIVRHARASVITINVGCTHDGLVILEISDDGIGFDTTQLETKTETGHYGLQGMAERVGLSGGTFSVESGLDKGTQIKVSIKVE